LLGRRVDDESAIAELDAPPAIRAVLADALAADPERRPRSAGDLRLALARAQQPAGPAFPRRSRWRVVALVAAAIAATATATYFATRPEPIEDPQPITGTEISRLWSSEFGPFLIEVKPDGTAYGVYSNRNGVLMGHYEANTLVGWWCESSRAPPANAGLLELHFVRGPQRVFMDGRWKFGDQANAAWHDDFSGYPIDATSPALTRRLVEHVVCPR
jgi:hypothetical protein